MNWGRIDPSVLVVAGLVVVSAVVVGLGMAWWAGQSGADAPVEANDRPAGPVRAKGTGRETAGVAEKEPAVPRQDLRAAAADSAAEMKRILLRQIRESPDVLDMAWIHGFSTHVRSEANLRSYFDGILQLGAKRDVAYTQALQKQRKVPTSNPHYFISEARGILFGRKRSVAKMTRHAREWLALAYYKEHQEKGSWEEADDLFMTALFKETTTLYAALQDSASGRPRESKLWWTERVRAHEAALVDRHLRIQMRRRLAREGLKGTGSSGRRAILQLDQLENEVDDNLLALGHLYLQAAERETTNIRQLRAHSERTFQAMAMVYQRRPSGDALRAVSQINRVQRDYLHRMALVSWHNARAAVAAGQIEEADEHYSLAMLRYLQAMSRWRENQRTAQMDEFRRLKQDFAAWKAQQQDRALEAGN